ncbi:ABC-type Na+ efflux pump permease subunit [Natranaerovirga pectinivora]|uniref:ABC-type Na+ efflux pump permease subunit n=1 Tax=Natranaerovirga pectinivora TaxID=682400 RepID=A0A4R3MKC0_9FIRM|nr:ABC transporter permease [Natranaerovirga pectinivora]TCT14873.1 ABC-type Na+ efflux pump permease subunit [Natranaerovirga pectinivora]
MKNNFRGWTSVFNFTFKQSTKLVGFRVVTTLISVLILLGLILMNVLMARSDAKTDPYEYMDPSEYVIDEIERSPINTVYILDNSGLEATDFNELLEDITDNQFAHTEFVTVTNQSRDEVVQSAAQHSNQTIAVIISLSDTGYELEAIVPYNSLISTWEAESFLWPMLSAFDYNKIMQMGLTDDQLNAALKPIVTSHLVIGDETNEIANMIKVVAPMFFAFVLYMMLILYGQTVSKSVSSEKVSKIMETLLSSVHPYAIITGKVLAITGMAILQFSIWIVSAIVGLYGGNAIAQGIYPGFENTAITIINFFRDNIGETAFTLPAFVLALVFFCVGFLFYCVLAGLTGCIVSKPEDVASTQSLFVFPIIISWLVSYLAPGMGNQTLIGIIRYIPFTSPFSVPVEILTGSISYIEGIISLLVLSLFSLFVIMIAGRIYKGLVLYYGQKLSFKMFKEVLITKSNH